MEIPRPVAGEGLKFSGGGVEYKHMLTNNKPGGEIGRKKEGTNGY